VLRSLSGRLASSGGGACRSMMGARREAVGRRAVWATSGAVECVSRALRAGVARQRCGDCSAATRSMSSMRVNFTRGRPWGSPRWRSWRSISLQPE
jgi:hypothetical protein